jgi:3-oxoacyl-[acyl-carrier protein] reductase
VRLRGMSALVTGGSGGLGAAIARALSAEGARVAVHYCSRRAEAEALARALSRDGGAGAVALRADLMLDGEARALVAQVAEQLGGLDVLVNGAGWTRAVAPQELEQLDEELLERTLRLKVHAPLSLVRAARPHLERTGAGCVVNVTSVAGLAARGSSLVYAAANAALSNLTRSLARTLAPRVRVNAVAPGYVDTGFAYPVGGEMAEAVTRHNHCGRLVTPEEVAAAVRFLCVEAPSITGEELVIDGGIGRLGPRSPESRT